MNPRKYFQELVKKIGKMGLLRSLIPSLKGGSRSKDSPHLTQKQKRRIREEKPGNWKFARVRCPRKQRDSWLGVPLVGFYPNNNQILDCAVRILEFVLAVIVIYSYRPHLQLHRAVAFWLTSRVNALSGADSWAYSLPRLWWDDWLTMDGWIYSTLPSARTPKN